MVGEVEDKGKAWLWLGVDRVAILENTGLRLERRSDQGNRKQGDEFPRPVEESVEDAAIQEVAGTWVRGKNREESQVNAWTTL